MKLDLDTPHATHHLTNRSGEEILRVLDGRVFVRGQETSDVERIGAAFREWAIAWSAEHNGEEP